MKTGETAKHHQIFDGYKKGSILALSKVRQPAAARPCIRRAAASDILLNVN